MFPHPLGVQSRDPRPTSVNTLDVMSLLGSTPGSPTKNPQGSPGLDPDNPFYEAGEDPSHPNPPENNGIQGLKQTLGEHDKPGAVPLDHGGRGSIYPGIQDIQDKSIEDIMDTLECPVCLETADTEPIYQCPEGHLICNECNSKLVDCPQCGHSLLNARNRTAEILAGKLRDLKGDKVRGIASSQTMTVGVDNPQKAGKGMFAYITYRVITRIGLSSGEETNYSVYRRFQDFKKLNDKLQMNYSKKCIIIPPPPDDSKITSVWSKVSNLNNSGVDRVIALRCRELDRYMNRLAKHPFVRKDPDFRTFLQEGKVAASLEVKKGFGAILAEKLDFSRTRNRLTVNDNDIWFKTKDLHHKELRNQLIQLQKDIKIMSQEKMDLFLATTTFRRNLLHLVAPGGGQRMSARSTKEREGDDLIRKIADLQNGMADLYLNQAEADDLLTFLAIDYLKLLDAVDLSMSDRLQALKDLQKNVKKRGQISEKMETLDTLQADFDKLSQTLRRELEHFDEVMREEFGETFTVYHKQYTAALQYNSNPQTVHQK